MHAPKYLIIVGGLIIGIFGIIMLLISVIEFQLEYTSIPSIRLILISPIGWIVFGGPTAFLLYGMRKIKPYAEKVNSKKKLYLRSVLGFLVVIVGSWLLSFILLKIWSLILLEFYGIDFSPPA